MCTNTLLVCFETVVFHNGNPIKIINELKEKLEPNTFKEAYKLYLEYKIKYLK